MHREKWLETFPRGSWVLTQTLNFKLEFTFGQETQETTKGSQVRSDVMKTKVEREYSGNIVEDYQVQGFCSGSGFSKRTMEYLS